MRLGDRLRAISCGRRTDGARVYWADRARGAVVFAPVTGGAVTVMASGETSPKLDGISATDVFWHTPTELRRAPLQGGPVTVVRTAAISAAFIREPWIVWVEPSLTFGDGVLWQATGSTSLHGDGFKFGPAVAIALDASSNFFAASATGISRFTSTGTPSAGGWQRLSLLNVFALAADATSIYVRAEHNIMRVARSDGATTTIATQQDTAGAIGVNGSTVYWTNSTTGSLNSGSIYGGSITTLAANKPGASDLALDASSAYFTTSSTIIRVTPR